MATNRLIERTPKVAVLATALASFMALCGAAAWAATPCTDMKRTWTIIGVNDVRSNCKPSLMSPDHATPGNGLLLFFRVDDFDRALQRVRGLVPRFEEEPHINPNTRTEEFSARDPEGYYVTISALQ